MNHDQLVELVYKLPHLSHIDFDVIESLSSTRLRNLLKPVEPAPRKAELISSTFIEVDGKLKRCEIWKTFKAGASSEVEHVIPCGSQVTWNGQVVRASIVLHWVRTGETVKRAPKVAKPFRAVVRVGATVKHLGYFLTEAERDGAIFMHKLQNSL